MRQQRPKYIFYTFLVALLSGIGSQALSMEFTFTVKDPKVEAAQTEKIKVLSIKKAEWAIKSDLIRKHFEDLKLSRLKSHNQSPDNYLSLENHAQDFEPLTESWLHEVDEFFMERGSKITEPLVRNKTNLYGAAMDGSPIDLAKKIVKKQLYYGIIHNWSCRQSKFSKGAKDICLSQTVFNKDGIPDEPGHDRETLEFIINALDSGLLYTPNEPGASRNYFLFKVPDLGYAEIDKKTLKTGRIIFQIGNGIENKLEPGAEDIKADNDDPSFVKPKKKGDSVASSSSSSPSGDGAPSNNGPGATNSSSPNPNTFNDFNDDTDF